MANLGTGIKNKTERIGSSTSKLRITWVHSVRLKYHLSMPVESCAYILSPDVGRRLFGV